MSERAEVWAREAYGPFSVSFARQSRGSICTSRKWVHKVSFLSQLARGPSKGGVLVRPANLAPLTFVAEDIVPLTYCCLLTTPLGPGTHTSVPKGFPLVLP